MRRTACPPRRRWQKRVEEHGLSFHTLDGVPYWDESACYEFTMREIDLLEEATQTLHKLCLDLIGSVIEERRLGLFLIPEAYWEFVIRSWEAGEPSIYGRFDLAYDGSGPPKMLEYNADTPTALLEAAVSQWYWLKDTDEFGDQFNSIDERLIEAWKRRKAFSDTTIHFAALADNPEDFANVEYLRDAAIRAGIATEYLDIQQIGLNHQTDTFVDLRNLPIHQLFKLYPWEWLLRDEYGPNILTSATRWIEPPWKMLLSCKAILPLLWQRYPQCPYLLPAAFEPLVGSFVRKPIHAREGANIELYVNNTPVLETDGPYEGPWVWQQFQPLRAFDGRYPVLGSWIVDDVACGLGIREDDGPITRNTSRFVPHRIAS